MELLAPLILIVACLLPWLLLRDPEIQIRRMEVFHAHLARLVEPTHKAAQAMRDLGITCREVGEAFKRVKGSHTLDALHYHNFPVGTGKLRPSISSGLPYVAPFEFGAAPNRWVDPGEPQDEE